MFIVCSNSNVFIGISIKMNVFRGWRWLSGQECLDLSLNPRTSVKAEHSCVCL